MTERGQQEAPGVAPDVDTEFPLMEALCEVLDSARELIRMQTQTNQNFKTVITNLASTLEERRSLLVVRNDDNSVRAAFDVDIALWKIQQLQSLLKDHEETKRSVAPTDGEDMESETNDEVNAEGLNDNARNDEEAIDVENLDDGGEQNAFAQQQEEEEYFAEDEDVGEDDRPANDPPLVEIDADSEDSSVIYVGERIRSITPLGSPLAPTEASSSPDPYSSFSSGSPRTFSLSSQSSSDDDSSSSFIVVD